MTYELSQLNRDGLPPLLENADGAEQWAAKRNAIRQTWLDYIGELPARPPARLTIKAESRKDGYTQLHVLYDTVFGDRIPAYLLLPDERRCPRPEAGYPAVLALHPTIEEGKADIATAAGRQNRTYALELVLRGYAVLAPDALTAGDRIYPGLPAFHSGPFYEKHPDWSTVAMNISDHMQDIDVLGELEMVNPRAVGAIGHSFGGYNSYFLAGADDRVRAYVSSCGFSPFTGDPSPDHWGYRDYPYTHIPKVSADLAQDRIPFEFHEIIALCAPVPSFHYAGMQDSIFPHWRSVAAGLRELAVLYRRLGFEERFRAYVGAGGHDFPPEMRELAYSFLDQWLKEKTHEQA